jgi:hypothetical protein
MLVAAADQRFASFAEDAEVADERLQPAPVARGRDHGVGLDPRLVGEQHVLAVETRDRGDDLDLSGLEEAHEPAVVGRGLLAATQRGDAERCTWKPIAAEVAEGKALPQPGDLISDA